jgi:hypothetical protein
MLLIYQNACRTLKEEDKLLISFLMCSKVLQIKNLITLSELRFLTVGGVNTQSTRKIPQSSMISMK